MPKSELCEKCAHTKVCFKDKNLLGDVFVAGNPMFFDNKKLFEEFKEREKNGFPCDDFLSIEERKVGEWIVIMDEPNITFDECKCSECGVVEYFNKGWKKFNYCPSCVRG